MLIFFKKTLQSWRFFGILLLLGNCPRKHRGLRWVSDEKDAFCRRFAVICARSQFGGANERVDVAVLGRVQTQLFLERQTVLRRRRRVQGVRDGRLAP
jgi:hypothetical protein